MVTQELLGYIRTEVAKGKTREEIHKTLISGGGWSEDDLSEAFRTVIPMQSVVLPKEKTIEPPPLSSPSPSPIPSPEPPIFSPPSFSSSPLRSFSTPSTYSPSPSLLKSTILPEPPSPSRSSHSLHSLLKFLVILIIIGGLGFSFWYYRPQMANLSSQAANLWSSLVNKLGEIHLPFWGTSKNIPAPVATNNVNNKIAQQPVQPVQSTQPTQPTIINPVNCGIGIAPKLGVSPASENDSALSCLGENAVNCQNATGILKDDFFPTIFEIIKTQNSCNFKLSYPADNTLVDITGKKLAGQSISCPIEIVKTIDNTNPASPKFNVPDKTDLSKYASQVYFYGTLGLFVENNLDPNKISAIGCSGEYIQSVIASYAVKKTK